MKNPKSSDAVLKYIIRLINEDDCTVQLNESFYTHPLYFRLKEAIEAIWAKYPNTTYRTWNILTIIDVDDDEYKRRCESVGGFKEVQEIFAEMFETPSIYDDVNDDGCY